jgi:hypothetical protein
MRVTGIGHLLFALGLAGLGVLSLFSGDFAYVWQPVPMGVPLREILAYLSGALLLAGGLGLLFNHGRISARLGSCAANSPRRPPTRQRGHVAGPGRKHRPHDRRLDALRIPCQPASPRAHELHHQRSQLSPRQNSLRPRLPAAGPLALRLHGRNRRHDPRLDSRAPRLRLPHRHRPHRHRPRRSVRSAAPPGRHMRSRHDHAVRDSAPHSRRSSTTIEPLSLDDGLRRHRPRRRHLEYRCVAPQQGLAPDTLVAATRLRLCAIPLRLRASPAESPSRARISPEFPLLKSSCRSG